jgi:large subunit ribosomal protein L15
MDILSNLHPAEGSRKKIKRIGRGQGSGHGGTATKGHKGQRSRSGAKFRLQFEGGQMPLVRRVPKFGFRRVLRVAYLPVNVLVLDQLVQTGRVTDGIITPEVLHHWGVVSKKRSPIKILGDGEVKSKLEVSAHAFSKSAIQKIELAGGKVQTLPW